MIEKWCGNAWNRLAVQDWKWSARIKDIRPAMWIVFIVTLLALTRISLQIYRGHGGHRNEIADAIGSIGFLYGAPQPDSSGSRIIYLQTEEHGLAIFADDMTTGKRQKLHEWPHIDFMDMHDQVSPVSPDDTVFAHSFNPSGEGPLGYIGICQADSGNELARMDAPEYMNEMVWLNPKTLVWLGRNSWVRSGPGFHLHMEQKHDDGTWKSWASNLELTNALCLTRLSDNTVAWLDTAGIRTMNVISDTYDTVLKSQEKPISGFGYSPETDQFLITYKEKRNYSLWRLKLNTNAPNELFQLAFDANIHNARWINGGKGYAYFSQIALIVRTNIADEISQRTPALVDNLVVTDRGRSLFFAGAVSNEAWAGIWSYDIFSQTLANIVPYSDYPSSHAVREEPLHCFFKTESHPSLGCYIYKPTNFDRHKKYPLLLGDTPFIAHVNQYSSRGPNWAMAMANCGAYVVIIDRKTWFGDLQGWSKRVMAVYDQLKKDPTIDESGIYLYSASAESTYMSKLIEEKPGLWKGLLFLSPTGLPDLSQIKKGEHLPKMLISAGADEGGLERYKRFQAEACGLGISVEVQNLPNTGHFLVSKSAVRDRMHAMVDFVFNN